MAWFIDRLELYKIYIRSLSGTHKRETNNAKTTEAEPDQPKWDDAHILINPIRRSAGHRNDPWWPTIADTLWLNELRT